MENLILRSSPIMLCMNVDTAAALGDLRSLKVAISSSWVDVPMISGGSNSHIAWFFLPPKPYHIIGSEFVWVAANIDGVAPTLPTPLVDSNDQRTSYGDQKHIYHAVYINIPISGYQYCIFCEVSIRGTAPQLPTSNRRCDYLWLRNRQAIDTPDNRWLSVCYGI